ncbi:acyltransferase domain-containing protein [Pendulispora brunnea]|uniref:Acyltransferase domain-containing protein n=1 Tax=Pendulispora brunnea TaxID=2905690 RepID=A0ABZ2JVU3_9BACT
MRNIVLDSSICITGLGCRFPAGIDSPHALWNAISARRDLIQEIPADRWDAECHYDPDVCAPGKISSRRGGFLADVAHFDAAFFDISPREAKQMDPQQRLALETAWEALEDAGLGARRLRYHRTSVFVGSMWSEYDLLASRKLEGLSPHAATGNDIGMIAARVAHAFGLRGPALSVNTASSSSLVAVHLALQSLQDGECDLALVGGSNLILTPYNTIKMTKLGTMAPDGLCKAFDHRANGYVRSEGVAFVVLQRLSRALEHGDRIYAVIRGSATNNDGRTSSVTAPSIEAQEALLRNAYARAGVSVHEVDYVEAHGTGTPLGDGVEAEALGRVLGAGRPAHDRLRIGSIKSNLGHTEATAGIAGLMKAALALCHGSIPASLHVESPNPAIPFDSLGLQIQTEAGAWPEVDRPWRAGVSAFGFGGTNCHVVLEAPPRAAGLPTKKASGEQRLPLLVSAKGETALRAQAKRWALWLEAHPEANWEDVVHTAACRRTHHDVRAAVMASSTTEAAAALRALSNGEPHAALTEGRARTPGKVVFVYPGHGSQWPAMGRELFAQSEIFANAVRACDAALRPCTGWSVESVLRGEPDALVPPRERDIVQPALFAMAVGLTALWRSWGVEPDAVVGHSQGEIAAAYVSGALSLEEAARVAAVRSDVVRRVSGAMALIEQPVNVVEKRLAEYAGALSVGAVNTEGSTVVSGDTDAVESLLAAAQREGIYARRVNIDYASHSRHVEPVLPELNARLAEVKRGKGEIAFFSTVFGEELSGEALDATYWCRNLREPVRLDRALARLGDAGHGVMVEVSAHPVLEAALADSSRSHDGIVVGSLQRDAGGVSTLLKMLASLHVQGHPVDWDRVLARRGTPVDLPTYAFQRRRYWLDTDERDERDTTNRPRDEIATWSEELSRLSPSRREPWLRERVCAEIAAVLGIAPSMVLPNAPLRDLGLRSPVAVELVGRLVRRTQLRLTAGFVYSYPSANAMAHRLLEEMFASADDPRSGVRAIPRTTGDASPMSDEELFDSIDALVHDDRPMKGAR